MIHLASSAKSKTLENDRVVGKSFTKMRNKSRLRTLPRGTPERTGKVVEQDLPIDTYWTLLVRYALTHNQRAPVMAKFQSLSERR